MCAHTQVEDLSFGTKDTTKSAFAIWQQLLHKTHPGKQQRGTGADGQAQTPAAAQAAHLQSLYNTVSDFGDPELVGLTTGQTGSGVVGVVAVQPG